MATFTPVTKTRLSYPAPAVTPNTNKYLLIGGGFKLLVGSGFRLIIQSVRNTRWTEVSKTR